KPCKVHLIHEGFALADADVQQAMLEPVRRLRDFFGERVQESSLRDLAADKSARSFATWSDTFCVIQWAEIKRWLGAWIADAKPELGVDVAASLDLATQLARRGVAR